MTYMIPSYWKSANIGDPKLVEFFTNSPDGWIVEEKADGSQFSFAVVNGELSARSRSKQLDLDAPEKMFIKVVDSVKKLFESGALPDNTIFRGEAITSEKHNTLKYSRVPKHHVIIFGVEDAISGSPLTRDQMDVVCELAGLETVPLFLRYSGSGADLLTILHDLLKNTSVLGGALVEGVVVKRVGKQVFYMDRPVFAKLVSEQFREQHKVAWSESNPGKEDIIQRLTLSLGGPARYAKAVQHLREAGEFTESVKDIGNIIKEVKRDVIEEGEELAKQALWEWAKEKIARAAGAGVPQWWKNQLANKLESDLREVEVGIV